MADSGSGGNQFVSEMKATVTEVAKDVKDSVGEAIEQATQSTAGSPLTPQQIQQKQHEDQQKIAETRRQIEFLKKVDQEQRKVRETNRQKEAQRLQSQKQEDQVKEIKLEQKKKQPINPAVAYAGKAEFKRGVGG